MKNKIFFILPVLIIYAAVFSGCSDSVSNSTGNETQSQAMVERQFVLSSGVKASPEQLIVVDLEDLNSPSVSGDTGPIGEDIVPYIYSHDVNQKFKIEAFSNFKMIFISDAAGDTLANIFPGGFAQLTVPAGNYKMHLITFDSYAAAEKSSNVVFIKPEVSGNDINTHLKAKVCTGCDFKDADLKNFNLRNVTLSRSSFHGTDLRQADLSYSIIDSCRMGGSILDSANFTNCEFTDNKWEQDYLTSTAAYAIFDSAYMVRCDFNRVLMTGVSINNVHFQASSLTNVNMINASAVNSDFSSVKISGSVLSYSNFFKTGFYNSNMQSSDISHCNLSDTDFGSSVLIDLNMSYSNIIGAGFCSSQRTRVNATGVIYNQTTDCWP
jgi:uncharacterized protein YjbI with pentapeptide repeats